MTIKYELKFFDYWHVSSGLSGGAALDSYVVKDASGLPYVPGKTIKGVVREMAELIAGDNEEMRNFVEICFGKQGSQKDADDTTLGACYFSNAVIDEKVANEITSNGLTHNLFEVIAATRIGENGIATDHSLRDIEAVLPISLIGRIENVDEKFYEKMKLALEMIKRMGLNRNRGLGRCKFEVKEL